MGELNKTIEYRIGQVEGKKVDKVDISSDKKENEEQERTTIKKKLFLEVFEKMLGMIGVACDKAGISRETYYIWLREDSEFHKKINEIKGRENEAVENRLKKLIMQEKQGSIHFYLDRRHPDYKPKSSLELSPQGGGPTLFEVIVSLEEKLKKPNGQPKPADNKQPTDNRDDIQDQGQAGEVSAVHQQPDTTVVLAEKDEEKHLVEAEAEGTEQGDRCGSARRLRQEARQRGGDIARKGSDAAVVQSG